MKTTFNLLIELLRTDQHYACNLDGRISK